MSLTDETARDEIYTLFTDIWADLINGPSSIVSYIPEVRYPGIEKPEKPDQTKFWVRNSLQIISQPQTCLNGGTNGSKTRYTTHGLFFSQLFCPKNDNNGITNGWKLSIIIRNAFRGTTTPGKIFFRNPTIKQLDDEAHFHRFNIVVEYEYDERL